MNLLFICGKNRRRSPTAEAVFAGYAGVHTESAGVDRDSDVRVGVDAIEWADVVLVMEKSHRRKLSDEFQRVLKDKRVVCLDIPDTYEFMNPELIAILERRVPPLVGIDLRPG